MTTGPSSVDPRGARPLMWSQPAYKGPERRRAPRWRPRPFRVLLFLLVVVAIGYTVGVLSLVNEESALVQQAGRSLGDARPTFPYEQVDLPRSDSARQFAWVIAQQESDPWVLYFHGNASTLASNVNISHYRELRNLGLNVCAAEYRGFAGLPGLPTEGALDTDARVAYDYLRNVRGVPANRIILFGWSLGSGVAVDLATNVEHAAVILEGAPASQSSLSQRRYPLFPMRLLMRNPFDSRAKIDRIHSPMLFLHGIGRRGRAHCRGAAACSTRRAPTSGSWRSGGGHVESRRDRSARVLGARFAGFSTSTASSVSSQLHRTAADLATPTSGNIRPCPAIGLLLAPDHSISQSAALRTSFRKDRTVADGRRGRRRSPGVGSRHGRHVRRDGGGGRGADEGGVPQGASAAAQGLSGQIVVRELTVQDLKAWRSSASRRRIGDRVRTAAGDQVPEHRRLQASGNGMEARRLAHVRRHRRSAGATGVDRRLARAHRGLSTAARRLDLPRDPARRATAGRTRPEGAAAADPDDGRRRSC